MRVRGVIQRVRDYLSRLRPRRDAPFPGLHHHKKPQFLTSAQHAELDVLCKKLFEKKNLIASGKLQVLGLSSVRARVGRQWPEMRAAVFLICEETIEKYLECGDIYIRYEDDSYILLFMHSSLIESDLKATLMAEEIKRRLFETVGIDAITMKTEMSNIAAHEVDCSLPFVRSIPLAFDQGRARASMEIKAQGHKIAQAGGESYGSIEFVAHRRGRGVYMPGESGDGPLPVVPFSGIRYMPVWDQYRGRHVSLLAVADYRGAGGHAMHAHRSFYVGRDSRDMVAMDLFILQGVIGWFNDHPDVMPGFGLICPVHFRTLSCPDGKKRYRAMCQTIDSRMKEFLLFLVLDTPAQMPWVSLRECVAPLKTYSRYLCAHVPLHTQDTEMESLRMAGFDVLGVFVDSVSAGQSYHTLSGDMAGFVLRARKHIINRTFVLGADGPDGAVAAAMADIRFIAGDAIHPCIVDPGVEMNSLSGDFFRLWQGSQTQTGETA